MGPPNFTTLIQDIILWPVDWPTNFIYGQKSWVYIILMAYLEMACHASQFSPSYYNHCLYPSRFPQDGWFYFPVYELCVVDRASVRAPHVLVQMINSWKKLDSGD